MVFNLTNFFCICFIQSNDKTKEMNKSRHRGEKIEIYKHFRAISMYLYHNNKEPIITPIFCHTSHFRINSSL